MLQEVLQLFSLQDQTEVKWNTERPEWNEQINIGFRYPSICERIRIQMKDK